MQVQKDEIYLIVILMTCCCNVANSVSPLYVGLQIISQLFQGASGDVDFLLIICLKVLLL